MAVKKKATKKVAKKAVKKVAKKATKKVAKKKVAKKVAKKVVAKKEVKKKEVKVAPEVKVEKLTAVHGTTNLDLMKDVTSKIEEDITAETDSNDTLDESSKSESTSTNEKEGSLSAEYNSDDEQDSNAFGYGWNYDEGLEKPEVLETEDEPFDEDSEYASGKPIGFDIEKK